MSNRKPIYFVCEKVLYKKVTYYVCVLMAYSRSKIKNEEDGAKSTHILYKANLSPELLKKYIRMMTKDGLVRKIKIGSRHRYRLTKKGLEFLKKLKSLDKMTHIIELLPHNRL